MKKRRTLIIALLLVAALCLGIGYATVSGSLIVDGKVVASAQPFNMHFVKFQAHAGTGVLSNVPEISCDTALSTTNPAKTVFLNVRNMATENDKVSATLTIRNDNDCTMFIKVDTILYGDSAGTVTSASPSKFTVTTDWVGNVKEMAAGGEEEIIITVTMNESCTDDYTGYFRITLNGTSVNPTP